MAAGEGGPFGAVVVRKGKVVGEGWNRVIALNDPTAHGEVSAIRDACHKTKSFSLEGCEIYTTGQPCPMCLGAIYWARIARIFYGFSIEEAARIGFDDRDFFQQICRPPADRIIPERQILGDEAKRLADDYLDLPERTAY